ncbi:unnamed protein product [Agarophyton chilense]|eukprot:gb/GEZJ01002788.1/.p1 GENE.gb/GEZJ01002788.1/~~gb/GEZJ01002788.1/.p1  ORF type:complete len:880 (-),score=93.55 gb/GEZJ01002788.1/:2300-4939(-)
MSSSPLPQVSDDLRIWSYEEAETVEDSEEPCSSAIRLPPTKFPERGKNSGRGDVPPPLPPKPAFARLQPEAPPPPPPKPDFIRLGLIPQSAPPPLPPKPDFIRLGLTPQSAPPPLPPKPDFARADKPVDAPGKRKSYPVSSANVVSDGNAIQTAIPPPPTRPVPPIPTSDRKPSYGEDGSWVPSFPDERNPLDPPQPPEPTIVSDGDIYRSSVGMEQTELNAPFLSDQLPRLKSCFPQPPYPLRCYRLASIYQTLNVSEDNENLNDAALLTLSSEDAEDALFGAFAVSRQRANHSSFSNFRRRAPVQWRPYERREPSSQAWKVLHEYLTNDSLKSHGRNRALLLLTGYVVGACLEGMETGINLLTEIVRRMRGAERSERDGSVFTLLVNIAAHASFVKGSSWSRVEEVARKVFSDVVEGMHGRQDDDVMWERALRCYLFLLKSSDKHPSINMSSKCLAALALRMNELTHTDVDHVLIYDGLYPRLHETWDEFLTSARLNMENLEEVGGFKTVLTLFADTFSPSARRRLFVLIYDFVVLKYLNGLAEDVVIRHRDNIDTLRALFESHDIANVLTHVFKVGPWGGFVVDMLRVLLFNPLTFEYLGTRVENSSDEDQTVGKKAFQEKTGSAAASDSRLGSQVGKSFRLPASMYISSTRALIKYLDKTFCVTVLKEIEEMAAHHSRFLFQRETMDHAREWKILRETYSKILRFSFARRADASNDLCDILTTLYAAVVEITSCRSSMKGLLHMNEIIIEFFVMTTPFVSRSKLRSVQWDSTAKMFLKGSISVPRQLLLEANPSMFSLLLLTSNVKVPRKRLSESRQCLVEFLGCSKKNLDVLKPFVNDNDPIVAYRAAELISKHSEVDRNSVTTLEQSRLKISS